MIKKLIQFLIHLIFVLFILALVIGVPAAWMIRRSYSGPEVHYFYTKLERDAEEPEGPGSEETKSEGPDETGSEEPGPEETEAEEPGSLRFVVLSDLYGYVFDGGNGIIADLVSNTFPDAILIDGNLIDGNTDEITQTTDLIKRLSQIAPVYYS